jgi:hypothetical protein
MNQDLAYEFSAVMPAAIATGAFVSLCTIQAPDGTIGPSGQPSGNFTNTAGLVNIPCMDAPVSENRIQATETRSFAEIMSKGYRHVLLNGYYPTIDFGQRTGARAVVDGVNYTILGVESDSQNQMTRLHLELSTV